MLMLLPCISHWLRILCSSLVSCAMTSFKLQTTIQKFLFDGPWNADNSDALGFSSIGFMEALRVEAIATLPTTPDLPFPARSSATTQRMPRNPLSTCC